MISKSQRADCRLSIAVTASFSAKGPNPVDPKLALTTTEPTHSSSCPRRLYQIDVAYA